MAGSHPDDDAAAAASRMSTKSDNLPTSMSASAPIATPRSPPRPRELRRTPSSPISTSPAMSGSGSSQPQTQQHHRHSFAENMRGLPASPRNHRQSSFSQQAFQDLLNNPPVRKTAGGEMDFSGRDWRSVRVHEIIETDKVRFVEMDTSVEQATNVLISSGSPNVVLLRDKKDSNTAIGTFDYSDLNAYLLLVVGLAQPAESNVSSFNELARKGREGTPIPLKDVKDLGRKEPLVALPHTANLTKAVELFGSGLHRIVVVREHSMDVIGILTQLRLVSFFWENSRNFTAMDDIFGQTLYSLNAGSHSVVAISGEKPLTAALELMNNEGITSLPVLDHQHNVVGNISHVDVRLLTKSTSIHLLSKSCLHFISVILSERGVYDGKDSYPVFHVNPNSTLAHTVAKLVATRSHRMWVVEEQSPASSGPPTPAASAATLNPPFAHSHPIPQHHAPNTPAGAQTVILPPAPSTSTISTTSQPLPSPTLSASNTSSLSGRLSGVVSLTDVLNLFARAGGLSPHDPNETRWRRRRSSSSSMRRSIDSARSSSMDISRSASVSKGGRRGL